MHVHRDDITHTSSREKEKEGSELKHPEFLWNQKTFSLTIKLASIFALCAAAQGRALG